MSKDTNKNYSILMIGNSFSYCNNMNAADGILYRVATEEGYNVTVTPIHQGGYYLHKFLDPSDPFGAQVKEKLENNRYDMIVIQEQSNFAIRDPETFLDSCKRFKEKADENGAELCLYATWGYKDGCPKLETFGPSSADMGIKLRHAYTDAAEKIGANIAQVGTAFIEIGDKLELYDTDKQHPSLLGSTLAAYTICGSLFGIDPKELKYTGDLDNETAELLKAAASNAKK